MTNESPLPADQEDLPKANDQTPKAPVVSGNQTEQEQNATRHAISVKFGMRGLKGTTK